MQLQVYALIKTCSALLGASEDCAPLLCGLVNSGSAESSALPLRSVSLFRGVGWKI